MRSLLTVLGATVVAAAAIAAPALGSPATGQKDIAQVAASSPQFSTLVSLLKKAGLVGALEKGNYTVFAGGNPSATEIALHEVAHSFANLADEYTAAGEGGQGGSLYAGPEPAQANITASPGGQKWAQWLGYDQPGIGVIGVPPISAMSARKVSCMCFAWLIS